MQRINVTRSSMPTYDEYCQEIKELWDSHWLTNMGKKHQEFEEGLTRYLEASHVMLYVNGHLALEGILEAYKFPRGAEVITTPFTFASTTHAIVRKGLIPVFCDISEKDYTIDVTKIESLITKKTVAILPVHVYGTPCDIEEIQKIADKYGLKVIYDAAHAFGVKYKGNSIANYGDAVMFSFHATKVFNTIEGGAICYHDEELTSVLADLKNFGIHSAEQVNYIGGNAKMNEFAAAMGICNLRHIDEEINKRRLRAERYQKRLEGIPGIRLNKIKDEVASNYAYAPILFDGYKQTRDEIFERLNNNGIVARKYFYPLTSEMDCYKNSPKFDGSLTPVAKFVADNIITVPLYADLAIDDVDKICDIILQ